MILWFDHPSTETLFKVPDNLLRASASGLVSILVLQELSDAFDTADKSVMLQVTGSKLVQIRLNRPYRRAASVVSCSADFNT